MKLISARVTNYKNVIDSGEFTLDDVTCLVGKNQSGKSTLLQALYRLNPVEEGLHEFNYETDYPKTHATEYNKGMDGDDRDHDDVVEGKFALDSDDLEAISKLFGGNCLKGEKHEIAIRVDYGGSRKWSGLSFDEILVLGHLAVTASISHEATDFLLQTGSIQNLRQFFEQSEFDGIEESVLRELLEFRDQNQQIIERGVGSYVMRETLWKRAPKFVYYDVYSQMRDHIALQEFIDRLSSGQMDARDLPMLGMLKLGGLEPRELIDQSWSEERLATEVETANEKITSAITPYWNVGSKFKTLLGVSPFREADDPNRVGQLALSVRINDILDVPLSSWLSTSLTARSRGFQWMFSFACLLRYLEDRHDQLIVLLDEPGLSLHGDAQRQLVGLIRKQSESAKQFVYTTHSPFMIDVDRLKNVRIVDGSDATKGATVRVDIDTVGSDSLLPLQSALGYSVLTPLMVGPNILLVEGVSDLVYLRTWQAQMLNDGRESLDERWSIVPCGGIGNIPAVGSFFHGKENLNLAVLCDGKSSPQDGISNSVSKKTIKRNRVVYLADHLDRKYADIEDVFDPGTYLEIFNKTTGNDLKDADLPKGPSRILQRLKDAALNGVARVDNGAFHTKCSKTFEADADHFFQRMSDAEKDRIEGLFKVLNSMLGTESK